jgi:lipopolysaccharide/colanic/teichoic acid biosynthesis glycosyltransferase
LVASSRLGLHRSAQQGAAHPTHLLVKRVLDISVGVAVAALALPLMASIAVAIMLDSPGPALYRPKRIGRNGTVFSMYKFRTMVEDAEAKLQEIAHLNLASGMVKIPNDPRVTRVGRWLRRFSLDELPQVYNVIAGHMSLVGPRPHDVHELPASTLQLDPRLSMRPGLTGLWQVSARSDPDLNRRVHFDHTYIRNWSLLLDMKIIAKTVPTVVRGEGGNVSAQPIVMSTNSGGGGEVPLSDRMQPMAGWPVAQPHE